jgi:hypothetical protein
MRLLYGTQIQVMTSTEEDNKVRCLNCTSCENAYNDDEDNENSIKITKDGVSIQMILLMYR